MDVFSNGCVGGEGKNEPLASVEEMHENELGQTRKVNEGSICRHRSKRTRRVMMFHKFMRDSALLGIVELFLNGKQNRMARTRNTGYLTWMMRLIAKVNVLPSSTYHHGQSRMRVFRLYRS